MAKQLWESQNKNWEIVEGKTLPVVWILSPYRGQSAILYDSGSIGYDEPKAVPKYVQVQVRRILEARNATVK